MVVKLGLRCSGMASILVRGTTVRLPRASYSSCDGHEDLEELDEALGESGLVPRSLQRPGMPHQMYLIQPYIKWGPKKDRLSSPELRLDEARALVDTLPGWRVVDSKIVSLMSFDKTSFFNKGQLAELQAAVAKNQLVTSVFLNVNMLRRRQHVFLEDAFRVPVFDRYTVVVNIFKRHAVTKEAKLQVAMAEIPYLWSRLKDDGTGGDPESDLSKESRTYLLSERERKIKASIATLRKNRELLRNRRRNLEFPVVAVVGYTNSGKTSLIKCLTREESLKPEDKLFATLDVTLHEGTLPSQLKVLYVDTIGFISDIPTKLLEPFVVTLEDALQADVIVHVRDVSHPDERAQNEHVQATLRSLNLSPTVIENIVVAGNKCDRLSEPKTPDEDTLLISCLNNNGIDELKLRIEKAVLKARGIAKIKIRVRTGGQEFTWLYKNSAVSKVEVDTEDHQFVYMSVLISQSNLGRFKHIFISGGRSA